MEYGNKWTSPILSYSPERTWKTMRNLVIFKVLLAMSMKITVFCYVTRCSVVYVYKSFGGTYYFNLLGQKG
jgi:hypothetical protein